MKRPPVILVIAALALSLANVSAQTPTNLAGKWTKLAGQNEFSGLGQEVTIAQDAKTLTVTVITPEGNIGSKRAYNLDGTDSKNTVSLRSNQQWFSTELVSKVKWDAGKLVITTTLNFNGHATDSFQTFSIDSTGNLVVESSEVLIGASPVAKYKKE